MDVKAVQMLDMVAQMAELDTEDLPTTTDDGKSTKSGQIFETKVFDEAIECIEAERKKNEEAIISHVEELVAFANFEKE